jgi:hypothetical protein
MPVCMCVCVTGIAERTMTSMGPISNARFSRNDLSCHFASLCHAAVSYRKVNQSFSLCLHTKAARGSILTCSVHSVM